MPVYRVIVEVNDTSVTSAKDAVSHVNEGLTYCLENYRVKAFNRFIAARLRTMPYLDTLIDDCRINVYNTITKIYKR